MSEPVNLKFHQPQQSSQKAKRSPLFRILIACTLFAIAVGIGVAIYQYGKRSVLPEADSTVRDIGERIILPNSAPRIGKISDITQFTQDPFLSQAEVDDIVLFYPHDGLTVKAILWRPSVKKIVDVALVTLPDSTRTAE